MKKITALITAAVLALGTVIPATAADSDMSAALAGVKSRIEIPANYTVFRSGMNDYGEKTYNFSWSDADGEERLRTETDSAGRLKSYSLTKNIPSDDYPSLPEVTKDNAQKIADAFIEKSMPELIKNERDRPMLETVSVSLSNGKAQYGFGYTRKYDGAAVLNNDAYINITAYDDTAYVSYANANWNYDAEFASETEALENPKDIYFDNFPTEMRYERIYGGTDETETVKLIYGFADGTGYISAVNGEVLEADAYNENGEYFAASGSSKLESAQDADAGFTDEETAELEKMETLISAEEAERILRSVPSIGITDTMTASNVRIYRTRPWYAADDNSTESESFVIGISLRDDNTGESVTMTADAETGEIKNIFRYGGEEKRTDDEKKAMTEFIKAVAPEKSAECEAAKITEDEDGIRVNMRRLVNGVPYNDNGISYYYSKKYSRISEYSLQWDNITDFTDPKDAVSSADAENKIMELVGLKKVYIPVGGKYRLCYTLSESERYAKIDAVTGEKVNKPYSERENINYSDISGHWAETAIKSLAEFGIGENEPCFRPNEKMTQKELLTYLASALFGNSYWDSSEEYLYNLMERRGFLKEEERNPSATVIREDAFVYMVRMMGYERVAELDGVFACKYSDFDELSKGKTGYAAILTGFGAVSGDGNNLRPKSEITRAECAMMVYKYLSNKGV